MQVGFSPINFQQRQNKTHQADTNFGSKINVKLSTTRVDLLTGWIEKGEHEDSPENRKLLKEVVTKLKERCEAKWDIPDIKEAVFKAWKKDKELEDVFKGY